MPFLLHRSTMGLLVSLLLLCTIASRTEAQQAFVHGSDVVFKIRTGRKSYYIGDQIIIHYTIKNISNGAMYAPRSQWEVKCGNPPHLWSRVEDSLGRHYEPGYAFSCLGPGPVDRMSLSERMQKDAVLLKPGHEATGSFIFDSQAFADRLKPGTYRLEAVLYGWNQSFDDSQLHELTGMGAPFLIGETAAVSQIELHRGAK